MQTPGKTVHTTPARPADTGQHEPPNQHRAGVSLNQALLDTLAWDSKSRARRKRLGLE